jgi:hypothetical protein
MKFSGLVQEIYSTNNGKLYPATNSAPRKDFAPISTKDGYDYPYQNTGASEMENPSPDTPISYPWELQTVSEDLSNGFMSVLAATKKINSAQSNPALAVNQKSDLKKLLTLSNEILNAIKNVAFKIDDIVNLSLPKPPEVKINSMEDKNASNSNKGEVVIKLPTK